MTRRISFWALVVTAAMIAPAIQGAQAPAPATPGFSLDQVLAYPFPDNLVASPKGSMIAWTFNERGTRNIFVAEGPDFRARRVTPYLGDEGQEITSLKFTPDGKTIVYVRGGDHGSNWPAEGNLAPNPSSSTTQPKIQIFVVGVTGRSLPKLLADGDEPAVSPAGTRVAFVRDRRIWLVPIDGSKPAEQAFFARGTSEIADVDADGSASGLCDRSRRPQLHRHLHRRRHAAQVSLHVDRRDSQPAWSLERAARFCSCVSRAAAARRARRSCSSRRRGSIMIATANDPCRRARRPRARSDRGRAAATLVDSIPRVAGGTNLQWAADDRLVFISYQDGWPHLYSIQHPGEGGDAQAADAGRVHGRARRRSPRWPLRSSTARTPARMRTTSIAVTSSRCRSTAPRPPVALTSGTRPRMGAGRHRRWPVPSRFSRPPRSARRLPAVMSIDGGAAAGARGRSAARARFRRRSSSRRSRVTFKSPDGVEVHAQLFKTAAGESQSGPALVYVHGGPPRQMLLGFHYMDYYANDYAANQYLASRGFIVLSVNYRLGIGYGHAFHFPEDAGARGAVRIPRRARGGQAAAGAGRRRPARASASGAARTAAI